MLKTVALLLICLASSVNVEAQVRREDSRKSQSYFTKIALATDASGCRIEITANEISPRARDCEFIVDLKAGDRVRLTKQTRRGKWIKLKLSTDGDSTFEIYVDNSSRRTFLKTFNLIFSRTDVGVEDLSCHAKTKREVIRSVGIPSRIQRKGKNETWHYGVIHPSIFRPGICGFDASSIEFRNGRVVSIGGII